MKKDDYDDLTTYRNRCLDGEGSEPLTPLDIMHTSPSSTIIYTSF